MNSSTAYSFPVEFRNVDYVAALYMGNKKAVEEKLLGTGLKAGLSLNGNPIIAVGLIEYKDSDLGAYNEVILAIPVVPISEPSSILNWLQLYTPLHKRKLGQYILHIPVTSNQSMIAGRDIWGYPKIVANIEHRFLKNHITTKITDTTTSKDQVICEGSMGVGIPIPSMDLMTYSFLNSIRLCTHVDVDAQMNWHPFSSLKITIQDVNNPIAKDLIELNVVNKKPVVVIRASQFKAKFNEGLKNN